nr:MAG TPA: tail completion protein [Caudoviricetes sp.]
MLNSVEILKQVRNKLKSIYNYTVYLDDSKENCDSPCFFLQLNILRKQVGKHKFFNSGNLYITYFATKNKTNAVEFYNIKDNISQLFHAGFSVKDRYIKINNISAITDGEDADIIYFTLQFEYFDTLGEDKITNIKIENIYQNNKS